MKTTKELLESVGINGIRQVSYDSEMIEAKNNALVMAKNLAKVMPLVKRDEPSTLDTVNLHKFGTDAVKFEKSGDDHHTITHNGKTVGTIQRGGMLDGGFSVKIGGNSLKHEISHEKNLKAAKDAAKYHLQGSK
jgi:hypothetical protein